MKITAKFFLFLFFYLTRSFAGDFEDYISKNNQSKKNLFEEIKKQKTSLMDIEKDLQDINKKIQDRPKTEKEITQEIDKKSEESTELFNFFSNRNDFLKCLNRELIRSHNISHEKCSNETSYPIQEEFLQTLQLWSGRINPPIKSLMQKQQELIEKLENIKEDIRLNQIAVQRKKYELIKQTEERDKNKINEIEQKTTKEDKEKNIKCDNNSPTIDLEENGPFKNIPRDNQDGVGTCFANTAKNLLISLSDGKINASFLELSLQSKVFERDNSEFAIKNLDGGDTCHTLYAVKEIGICPQIFSRAELGEASPLLFNSKNNYKGMDGQAILLEVISNFIKNAKVNENDFEYTFFSQFENPKKMIESLKDKKEFKKFYPLISIRIGQEWVLAELLSKGKSHSKKNYNIKYNDFFNEYDQYYSKFLTNEIKAILEGKNLDQIFEIYKEDMKGFIEKFDLQNELPKFKDSFLNDAKEDFNSPTLKEDLRNSIVFFNEHIKNNHSGSADCIDCTYKEISNETKRIENLIGFMNFLKKNEIDESQFFAKDNKLKSIEELLLLAIAPECLNNKNRQQIDFKLHCDNGYDFIDETKKSEKPLKDKTEAIRKRVVTFLKKGLALGNGMHNHINTIVGIRYNKENKKCEYKIRESQDGTSTWQLEDKIIEKMENLTTVYKE